VSRIEVLTIHNGSFGKRVKGCGNVFLKMYEGAYAKEDGENTERTKCLKCIKLSRGQLTALLVHPHERRYSRYTFVLPRCHDRDHPRWHTQRHQSQTERQAWQLSGVIYVLHWRADCHLLLMSTTVRHCLRRHYFNDIVIVSGRIDAVKISWHYSGHLSAP